MGKELQRYVIAQVAGGVLLTIAVIVVMIVLIDFVELSRTLGQRPNISSISLVGLALLRAPSLLETTLPFVFLFGTMWGLFRLNRRSELVVMRASGMSAWRFIAPAVFLAVASGLFGATAFNPAASLLNSAFESRRDAITSNAANDIDISEEGVWLRESRRDGQIVMRADAATLSGRQLDGVTMFVYGLNADDVPVFRRRIDAAVATLRAGFWQLRDAWESEPDTAAVYYATLAIPTSIDPATLLNRSGGPRTLDFWELPVQTRLLEDAGFASIQYQMRWQRLLALPLTLAAMAVLAAAASLRLARRGGAFWLAVMSAGAGFAFYFVDNFVATFGTAGVLPPFIAAWATSAFTLLAGIFVISTLEDG